MTFPNDDTKFWITYFQRNRQIDAIQNMGQPQPINYGYALFGLFIIGCFIKSCCEL